MLPSKLKQTFGFVYGALGGDRKLKAGDREAEAERAFTRAQERESR